MMAADIIQMRATLACSPLRHWTRHSHGRGVTVERTGADAVPVLSVRHGLLNVSIPLSGDDVACLAVVFEALAREMRDALG